MWSLSCPVAHSLSNTDFLRHHARCLLRLAHADNTATALPVLRRLNATQSAAQSATQSATQKRTLTLGALYETRATIQLKHVLNMIAVELGYAGWDACKQSVEREDSAFIDRYRFDAGLFNDHETLWFAGIEAARDWQREQGGYIVEYGDQAVAILWCEVA